jgi:hypothetical protein
MLPKRWLPVFGPFLMSVIMVTLMTAIITAVNTGTGGDFVRRWVDAFLVAWPIAFAFIYFFAKRINGVAAKMCTKD